MRCAAVFEYMLYISGVIKYGVIWQKYVFKMDLGAFGYVDIWMYEQVWAFVGTSENVLNHILLECWVSNFLYEMVSGFPVLMPGALAFLP